MTGFVSSGRWICWQNGVSFRRGSIYRGDGGKRFCLVFQLDVRIIKPTITGCRNCFIFGTSLGNLDCEEKKAESLEPRSIACLWGQKRGQKKRWKISKFCFPS